jgi:HSP20 family protein
VAESEKELTVTAELPGLDEKSIEITIAGDMLTLKGEKHEEKEEKERNWHRVERSFGSFQRVIQLPCEVESNKADARFKNGVLTIALPKCKEALAKAQKVQVSGQ